jgi:hypothetical protein
VHDHVSCVQVFHAPHLVGLSSRFGATVNPIVYKLDGNNIYSNVKYYHPAIGTGWLSASGACQNTAGSKSLIVCIMIESRQYLQSKVSAIQVVSSVLLQCEWTLLLRSQEACTCLHESAHL